MAAFAAPGVALAGGHPIIIVTRAAARSMAPAGAPAGLPLDLLGAAPDGMSGPLTPNTVIAQQTVRAADAAVLGAAVEQGVIDIPAGTVLAKVTLKAAPDDPDGARVLWCRTGPLPPMHANATDCLEDPAHAGAFSRYVTAPLGVLDASFAVADVSFGPGRQIEPTAYRQATPAERPTTRIGYRWCSADSDGVRIPYRFTSVIYQDGYGWRGDARACPFGEWSDGDKQLLKVDRIKVRISTAQDGPHYQVLDRIDAGPITPYSASGQSLQRAEAPAPDVVAKAEARAASPLLPAGLAEGLSPGLHVHGDEIVQAAVVHGVTGVLKSDAVWKGLVPRQVNAGQYAFGVPMHTSNGQEGITWCVPSPAKDDPNRFSTVCFPAVGSGYAWTPVFQPLMPTEFSFPANSRPEVIGLDVERKAASLGAPMKLTYVFDKWRALPFHRPTLAVASVGVEMRVNGEASPIGHIYVAADDQGVVRFPILNGLIAFSAVDRTGAPLKVPALNEDTAAQEAFLQAVEASKLQVAVVAAPTASLGALPITGVIALRVRAVVAAPATLSSSGAH